MTISKVLELASLLTPPSNPVHTDVNWEVVEKDIGMQLPSDYKKIISLYGSVSVCSVILLVHPHSCNYKKTWSETIVDILNERINDTPGGRDEVRYPDYPAKGGIFPVAMVFDNLLCWVTMGAADEWKMLYWCTHGIDVKEYPLTLSELLVEMLNDRIDLIPRSWVEVDSPKRKAEVLPIADFFQPPDEYYRNQRR